MPQSPSRADFGSFCRSLSLCGALLVATPMMAMADDWPQFRGPNCSGLTRSDFAPPTKFGPETNVRWSADVGDGIGSPVLADGRLFINGMTDKETVSLMAFDAASGKLLWRRDWDTGHLPEIHKTNSHAATTPACDADRVYFYFSTLGMLAVDAKTGEDVWRHEMPTPFFVFKWGPGMSPTLHGDKVIFCQDDDLYPAVYAFDKATGKVVWKDDRFDMAVNYSHPVVCRVNGRDEIVIGGTGMLVGYDPDTGARRWTARVLLRNIKTTPVAVGDKVYVSIQSGGIANQWLVSVDQAETGNSDGKLHREEVQAFVGAQKVPEAFFKKTFGRGDLNKDGFLEGKELDLAFLHPDNFAGASFTQLGENAASQHIVAVRAGGEGDVTNSHVLWKHETKYTDHIVSPFLSNGRMFLIKEGGITTAFDAKTGHSIRDAKRVGRGGGFFASPVGAGGKIFIAGENGLVIVLEDSKDFTQLAANDMGESILATPAITSDGLFIRTRTKIYCIGE